MQQVEMFYTNDQRSIGLPEPLFMPPFSDAAEASSTRVTSKFCSETIIIMLSVRLHFQYYSNI